MAAMRIPVVAFLLAVLLQGSGAFMPGSSKSATDRIASLEYVAPDTTGVTEEACLDTARRMQLLPVAVPSTIHKDQKVGISFVHWPADKKTRRTKVPLILIHGFDSSCLEYRRLGARLAAQGIDTYAVDLLGWGFTQLDGVETFSADAKVTALTSFINEVSTASDGKFCIAGASLGGAAAIEVASTNPNCAGLVLLDAQGFVDGIGPMALMPKPVAQLGVGVLKSIPLRSSANQMSYFNKETFATDEAVTIGRMHCLRQGWDNALVSFMQSGGFSPSSKLSSVDCPSLVIWGRQDGILDGEEFAPKFLDVLPNAELQWIEECGHVPHLEKPDETTLAISNFVKTRADPLERMWLGFAGFGATAAAVADGVKDSLEWGGMAEDEGGLVKRS